ncbi:nucleotidyltransferase [Streptococcus mutans]|uniref:nucleotidyltransferase n=1 Tax=Streptococcus mutans TaxID=1309 RepID=UPI0001B0575D|nr:nucleotidyltransferase [Streptococcus mutans]MCB4945927.1 nucleotidyltransferase [Streptococcus mutans]MCB4958956.1 nucleotidyltransferase [Streptococcus mutans]MCB4968504.1 nucleotidyltransferase [Streptococcus mutans]MCB5076393.1 nucleotidyltransferase [Streptococcus mutans]MCB5106212.1 nucleotidyltransferase [Streptococcus mutans]
MENIIIGKEIKELIEELDVSDSEYEEATKRYNSIAEYIKNSELDSEKPDIYLQGSFKLGTAIRPLTEDGAYDIDIVCNFTKLKKEDQSQSSLKYELGKVVKQYAKSKSMSNDPKESKRCWTLKYVDDNNFHIDILPSVPLHNKDDEYIAITDKAKDNYFEISSNWETSNPKGYADWFREVSKYTVYQEKIAKRFYASIEKVPEYKVRTPLQRIVQILKRHAEICFEDDIEFKPGSVIITTLAAKQYRLASSIHNDFWDVISYIINHLKDGIELRNGKPCVYNPVNYSEVLSGKWDKDKRYVEAFNNWLKQLESDFNIGNDEITYPNRIQYLKRSLFKNARSQFPIINVTSLRHHQKSKWTECLVKDVFVKAMYSQNGFRWKTIRSGTALNKHGDLKFEVKANDLKQYEIWWQITNTGKEAENANSLRGDFYSSELIEGKKIKKESTLYTGRHFVEAYLVKDGICFGKSQPFEVNIVDNFTLDFAR